VFDGNFNFLVTERPKIDVFQLHRLIRSPRDPCLVTRYARKGANRGLLCVDCGAHALLAVRQKLSFIYAYENR
jgi:hypothetical protein